MPTQIAVMHHNQHATRLDNTTHASYTSQCHWTGVMLGKSNGNKYAQKCKRTQHKLVKMQSNACLELSFAVRIILQDQLPPHRFLSLSPTFLFDTGLK